MKMVGDWAWERATNWGWAQDGFEDFQRRRHSPRVELLEALRTFSARQADGIIVPSRYLARWVAGWGVPVEKIQVVYNAVERAEDVPSAPVPLDTRFKVISVGRLAPWKHVDNLIEVVASPPEVGLVIVGDGPLRAELEGLAGSLGVAARVYLAGLRDRDEVFALMKACDLLVLNSSYEGLPHAVLEAMAVGLPVVATDVGGTGEVVQDGVNGRLVPPGDNEALAQALVESLTDDEWRRRSVAAGRRLLAERFSWEQMVDQTEELLCQTATEGGMI